MKIRKFARAVATAAGFAAVSIAQAQTAPPRPAGPFGGPPVVHQLLPTVYWTQGGGGNAGIIVGDKGVILVDATMSAASAAALLRDVAAITSKPVTTVILTHGDLDHVGGLGALPAGIAVIAQAKTAVRLSRANAEGHGPVPADRLPNHVVGDRETVQIEGVKIALLHLAPAHTDGDLVVYLPAEKIAFTGDVFAMDQSRALIHREQQGSSDGWVTFAKGIVALDAERFVVGHGDVQTRQSLQPRIDTAIAEKAEIKALLAKGETLAQIQSEVNDPPRGQLPSPTGPHFPPFSEVVYQELSGSR